MQRPYRLLGVIVVLCVLPTLGYAQKTPSEKAAKTVISAMNEGQFDKVFVGAGDAFRQHVTPDQIRTVWNDQSTTLGKLVTTGNYRSFAKNGYTAVMVTCTFEHGILDAKMTYDPSNKLIGLQLVPRAERRSNSPNAEAARTLVNRLVKGQFDQITPTFDARMQSALPMAQLATAWQSILAKAGPFIKQQSVVAEGVGGIDTVTVVCKFTKGTIDIKTVYDQNHKVSGLWFADHKR